MSPESGSRGVVLPQVIPCSFGEDEQSTWKTIYHQHQGTRGQQVFQLFDEGLKALCISGDQIPDLGKINQRLQTLSGFSGVFVNGLEKGDSFFKMLARKQFPIGNFIRSKGDLSYTPEPDIVHDLYGHLPFLANPDYAKFCQEFGELACRYLDREDLLRQLERFFWFTIEFGLIKTPDGVRVFGAGIASSIGECAYALSSQPQVLPYDIDHIRYQEFRIDEMQRKLFLLESTKQLYDSLPTLQLKLEQDR